LHYVVIFITHIDICKCLLGISLLEESLVHIVYIGLNLSRAPRTTIKKRTA